MDKALARHLAQVVGDISQSPLPNEISETAKLCLLDFLAACYAGVLTEVAKSGLASLEAFGEGDAVLLIGNRRSSLLGATYFHSLIATIEDLDDAHRFASGLHMSATTFPVILAIGGLVQCSGQKFLKAAVAGYEISSRLTRAADMGFRERGFHSTGTAGPFGACAAACVLLGLDEDSIVNAFGITASGAGGLFAFLEEGSTVRHVHAAWASTKGLEAAIFAEKGLTGPDRVFESEDGFLNAYTTEFDSSFILAPYPSQSGCFEISNAYHKIFNACGHAIPTITGMLSIRNIVLSRLDQIKEINVKAYKGAAALTNPEPSSADEAKFSLPTIIGIVLVHGNITKRELEENLRYHPDVAKIASKVSLMEDPEISSKFPKLRATAFDIIFDDGEKVTRYIDKPIGMPENPVSWSDVEAKFGKATDGHLVKAQQHEIIEAIVGLDNSLSMKGLLDAIGRA